MALSEKEIISRELANYNPDDCWDTWIADHPEILVFTEFDDHYVVDVSFPKDAILTELVILDGQVCLLRYQLSDQEPVTFDAQNPIYPMLDKLLQSYAS